MVGLVGGFTAVSAGILGMVTSYTSLEKAQTIAQRSSDRLNQARITEQQLQAKVNEMQAKGLTGTEAYNLTLQKLELQHHKVQTAQETATIAQQRANEAMANFATQIAPQALSVIGGLASAISSAPGLWSKLQGSIGGAGGGLTSFITGPVGIALIGIGALATVLTLVATNAFGFRDALNAAGKAIGDAVPFLQPLLIAIKALGEQVGLTGNDTKQGFNGMNQDVVNFATESGDNLRRWIQQINSLGTDLRTENYQKFWLDLGKMMADNSASNVKGMQQMWAAMLVDFNNFVDGLNKGLHALGGVVQAGFQLAFGGLASWFETTVISPISKAWDALIAKLSAPLPKVPPSLLAPIPGAEKPIPAIWEKGGGIFPAGPPPPPPPTITGVGGGAAGAGGGVTAAVTAVSPTVTATATAMTGLGGAIDYVSASSLKLISTNAATTKSLTDTQVATNKAYNEALKFAQVHNMVIPAAMLKSAAAQGRGEEALISYVNAHKDYQLELDKVNASNAKLQQQITATSERLTTGRAAQEDYTAGVLEQEAALQAMQEQHLKSAGSLATLEAQIKSGAITNAAYAQGIDEQRKAFLDSQVAVAKSAGAVAEYTNEVRTGVPQIVAFKQGAIDEAKALLDQQVALSNTAGKQAELSFALSTGRAQAIAWTDGMLQGRAALQQLAVDTDTLRGKLFSMAADLKSGASEFLSYQKGLAEGGLAFVDFMNKASEAAAQNQVFDRSIADAANKLGFLSSGLEANTKNQEDWIAAMKGDPDAIDKVNAALKAMDDNLQKLGQGFIDQAGKAKTFKEFLKGLDPAIRAAIPKDIEKDLFNIGHAQEAAKGWFGAIEGILSGDGRAALERAIPAMEQGMMSQFSKWGPDATAKLQPFFDVLNHPERYATDAAWGAAIQKAYEAMLAPVGKSNELVKSLGSNAQSTQGVFSGAMDQMSGSVKKFSDAFVANMAKVNAMAPSARGGWGLGTIGAAMAAGQATAAPAKPTGAATPIDTTAATAALKALQAEAQAIFNNIAKMAQGAKDQINAFFLQAAKDVDGSLRGLMANAQAIFNNIAAMPPGVASSMNSNFASGAKDADGSLQGLQANAQAIMNNIAKMPTGVAASLNKNFNTGANDAAGALNNLQNKAQGVMNNIVAAAHSAANAVAAVGTAIRNLPNKTVTITANTSQAMSAIHSVQSAVDNLHGKSITVSVGLTGPGVGFLQHGFHGVVSSPHLFMIGEAGPERVDVSPIPSGHPTETPTFDRTVNLIPALQGGGARAATGVGAGAAAALGREITIIVNLAGREIWREVRKNIFEDISQF